MLVKIFVAGTTAGRLPLARAVCDLGYQVTGMTRADLGVDRLRELNRSVKAFAAKWSTGPKLFSIGRGS
jgi:hypothetical protein